MAKWDHADAVLVSDRMSFIVSHVSGCKHILYMYVYLWRYSILYKIKCSYTANSASFARAWQAVRLEVPMWYHMLGHRGEKLEDNGIISVKPSLGGDFLPAPASSVLAAYCFLSVFGLFQNTWFLVKAGGAEWKQDKDKKVFGESFVFGECGNVGLKTFTGRKKNLSCRNWLKVSLELLNRSFKCQLTTG